MGSAPGLPDCTGRRTVSLCSPPALLCVTPTGRQHPALQSENLSRMWAQQGGVLTVRPPVLGAVPCITAFSCLFSLSCFSFSRATLSVKSSSHGCVPGGPTQTCRGPPKPAPPHFLSQVCAIHSAAAPARNPGGVLGAPTSWPLGSANLLSPRVASCRKAPPARPGHRSPLLRCSR